MKTFAAVTRMGATAAALAALVAGPWSPSLAQVTAQPAPPTRPLGSVVARTTQTFQAVTRAIAIQGSVFVNDYTSHRVWMFDSTLAHGRIVLDSTSADPDRWYGQGPAPAGLLRFRGDSMLMVRSGAPEGVILGPDGKVSRIVAIPNVTACAPQVEVDNAGWLTCQVTLPLTMGAPTGSLAKGDSTVQIGHGDSAGIAAINFKTWTADTVGRVAIAPRMQVVVRGADWATTRNITTPIFASDRWGVFRDGTLAIARGIDYHVDIVDLKGVVTRGPRAPFSWRRITDDDKARMVDSLRRADSTVKARQDSLAVARGAGAGRAGVGRIGGAVVGRAAIVTEVRPAAAARGGPLRTGPDDWPSYWPPIAPPGPTSPLRNTVDADDRFWVEEQPVNGATAIKVFGVFDKQGRFVDRVSIPASQTLVGFGPGGAVYVTSVDAGRTTLQMVRFR